MSDALLENLEDLNLTFQSAKTDIATSLLKERSGDTRYLNSLLRDHSEASIVSGWQQNRRDDIDDLLEYYSLLEIAAIAGHIPARFPEGLARQILPKLKLEPVRRYYEEFYVQKLPTLLRLRLEGRHALTVPPDNVVLAAYAQLADVSASMRANEELTDLLTLLDGYEVDGCSWDELEKLLAHPKKYVSRVLKGDENDMLVSAASGFHGFLSFCRDFQELLWQVESQPLVQSAFWHLFSYWFERLADESGTRGKLGKLVEKSLDASQLLAGEIDNQRERRQAKADLKALQALVLDLADRRYAAPVEAAIAAAERVASRAVRQARKVPAKKAARLTGTFAKKKSVRAAAKKTKKVAAKRARR